jgi:hypothetical protein
MWKIIAVFHIRFSRKRGKFLVWNFVVLEKITVHNLEPWIFKNYLVFPGSPL